MGSYYVDGNEDGAAIEMLKISLSEDIRDLLNSSFEIDDAYDLTDEDHLMMREVSMSALLTNMIDLLQEMNLGSSAQEREVSITKFCGQIKDAYLMISVARTGEVN